VSANSRRRSTPVNRLVMLAMLTTAGCGVGETVLDDTVADSVALAVVDSGLVVEPFDPDPVPRLPGEGDLRDYHLLLVNRLDGDAFVFASAGAARIALDTVPASDSTFVDIRLRADQVTLEAENGSGQVVDSASIDLVRMQINRWEITPRDRSRMTLRASGGMLVTTEPGDYPRGQRRPALRRSSEAGF